MIFISLGKDIRKDVKKNHVNFGTYKFWNLFIRTYFQNI